MFTNHTRTFDQLVITQASGVALQYLCDGFEDDIFHKQLKWGQQIDNSTELEYMINSSGKMVLLHKLLPKLRAEGRKVCQLINAQHTIVSPCMCIQYRKQLLTQLSPFLSIYQ